MSLERALFLKSAIAAFMTGGLDIWSAPGTVVPPVIRILLTADRGGELPARADGDIFTFDDRRWRGTPSLITLPDGRSGVVATVDIEDYLYGVLPIEASPGWPAAALQAQAIVARTFALARRTLSRPYDVVMSQLDQRFGGIESEYPATNDAVDATRAALLLYAGGDASAFYAACCGGHTADAATIWGHDMLPYLRGVPDPYCVAAPDYRWQRSVPLDRVRAALAAHVAGDVTGFALGPADSGGRPLSIDILSAGGRTTLSTITFRTLLGTDTVRSTWLRTVSLEGRSVIIAGSGRGHGVGMCQWGARAMGLAGMTSAEILAFYFPGTTVSAVDRGT